MWDDCDGVGMERRTFIATTGVGIGIGAAGCLDDSAGNEAESSDGRDADETVDLEDDGEVTAEASDGESDAGNGEADTDDAESTPATFEVTSMTTNSPIGGGESLEVAATIANVGDERGTTDVELVVGHDPQIEDSERLTLEPGETVDLGLEFQAGEPTGDSEAFPVEVDTGADEATETVVVEADANGDDPDAGVTFDSCRRATVNGDFEDGDVVYASTGFYDEAGYGNTVIEDGVTIGEDVDASGVETVVFEIEDDGGVSENGDELVVSVPDYGEYGTVITGLTTDQDDYAVAGITHGNPHAETCLTDLESDWENDAGD